VYVFGALTGAASLQAQSQPLFQNATLTGSGNAVNATRVPVVTPSGSIVYVDVSLQFNADATGNLTLASGSPQISLSASIVSSSFKAGTYIASSNKLNGSGIIVVSGPGIADGGATVWTSVAGVGAFQETYPVNVTWYVGPMANSPYAARVKAAGLTSTVYSYGVIGAQYDIWATNDLVGVSQTGNAITFTRFTNNGKDMPSPVDQITFNLKP